MEPHILYGRHALLEALRTHEKIEKIFILQSLQSSYPLEKIYKLAKSQGIPLVFVPRKKLEQLSGSHDHQGAVGILSSHQYAELDETLHSIPHEKKLLLALDHLEDPQNLGSLLRTADAVGVSGIFIPKRRSVGLTPGAAKASAGAIQHVPVVRVTNLHQTLLSLKKEGFTIIGADQSASQNYKKIIYPKPLVLVLGNEQNGLHLLIKNFCDTLVKIPMKGNLNSLNVGVAGALILYEIFSQWNDGVDS